MSSSANNDSPPKGEEKHDAAADNTLTLHLTLTHSPSAPRIPLALDKTATASALRQQVADATGIPLPQLRLIFRGRILADEAVKPVVEEFNLEDGCVLHCMGKPVVVGKNTTSSTSNSSSTAAGSSVSFSTTTSASAATTTTTTTLQQALTTLRSSNSPSVYVTAVKTLQKILDNIVQHPMEQKYRKVKRSNAAFGRRLGNLTGGADAMQAAGFSLQSEKEESDDDEVVYFVLQASPEAWPRLLETQQAVTRAVQEAEQAQASAAPVAAAGSATPTPGMGMGAAPGMGMGAAAGMGSMPPMPPGMTPDMQRAATQLMSDPNALQGMLQNPMVRQMMENDPRFAGNPMMRQSLDSLANNPQMLQQVGQMMQDPAMQSRMQQMMTQQQQQQGGHSNLMPQNTTTTNPPNIGPVPTTTNNNNATQQQQPTDQEMTEEEMIEEAIRRSLQEG